MSIKSDNEAIRHYIKLTDEEAFYLWLKVTDEEELTPFLNRIVTKLWRMFRGTKSDLYKQWAEDEEAFEIKLKGTVKQAELAE